MKGKKQLVEWYRKLSDDRQTVKNGGTRQKRNMLKADKPPCVRRETGVVVGGRVLASSIF